ncbi:MAG: Lrp/AsnC family transcriptional regulator [Magnetococcales bacterium]|nr:Lrp/AsnC family transcriptional regulator [Magnetococcales bacterium]
MMAAPVLTAFDRTLINQWQSDFPICERPFDQAAAMMAATPDTMIHRIGWLLQQGYLSRFAPMYHAERLGGHLTLVALQVDEERLDEVAGFINSWPEVSQHYVRDHRFNLWFVLATETLQRQADVLAAIEASTGCLLLNLPKLAEFHIGFRLRIGQDSVDTVACPSPPAPLANGQMISATERALITATQQGLPLVDRPYHAIANALDLPVVTVTTTLQQWLANGMIRRIGVVPNHYRLGLTANAMTVWDVADDRVAELGQQLGALGFVTHCYHRPRRPPHWPYNLFAMVHGHDRATVTGRIGQMQQLLSPWLGHADVLYSQRILKKTGFRLAS